MHFWITVSVLVTINVISPIESSPFLRSLLTTTTKTPETHISDYRNQAKSDSRAEKLEALPEFDYLEKPTTARIKTRAELYAAIIGNLLSNVRGRIRNAAGSLVQRKLRQLRQQHKQSSIETTKAPADIWQMDEFKFNGDNKKEGKTGEVSKNDDDSNSDDVAKNLNVGDLNNADEYILLKDYNNNKSEQKFSQSLSLNEKREVKRRENDKVKESTTGFIGLSLDDENKKWNGQGNFNSDTMLRTVGSNGFDKNFIQTLLATVLGWTNSSPSSSTSPPPMASGGDLSQYLDTEYKLAFLTTRIITPLIIAWNSAMKNLNLNSEPPAAEEQEELLQLRFDDEWDGLSSKNESSSDEEYRNVLMKMLKLTKESKIKATLAFQNAFAKYAALMAQLITKNYTATDADGDDVSPSPNSNSILSVVGLGSVNVPNNKTNINKEENMSSPSTDDDDDDDNDDDDDDSESSKSFRMDPENFGVLVLEILGSIAGLAWGAFSQIGTIFNRN